MKVYNEVKHYRQCMYYSKSCKKVSKSSLMLSEVIEVTYPFLQLS